MLPETFLSGFSNDIQASADTMDGEGVAWLRALAVEVGAVICGSLAIRENGIVYNRLLWVRPDGSFEQYDKRHLFRMAGEHTRYGGGNERLIVELKGWRILPQVCYDLRFPVWLRNRRLAAATGGMDYDLAVFVANWPAPRRQPWRTLLRARAIENLSYVVGVNRVGVDGNEIAVCGRQRGDRSGRRAAGRAGRAGAGGDDDARSGPAAGAPRTLPGMDGRRRVLARSGLILLQAGRRSLGRRQKKPP